MKPKNILLAGLASLVGIALIAGAGMRAYTRLHSRPSPEIEQQFSQNGLYQEIASQSVESPFKRELMGMYIDTIYPIALRLGNKLSVEQREYLKTNRIDAVTGKHRPYTAEERAFLWHAGTNPDHPSMGKDYVLDWLAATAFQR